MLFILHCEKLVVLVECYDSAPIGLLKSQSSGSNLTTWARWRVKRGVTIRASGSWTHLARGATTLTSQCAWALLYGHQASGRI